MGLKDMGQNICVKIYFSKAFFILSGVFSKLWVNDFETSPFILHFT